jgi:hypothetical protein
MLKDIFIDTNVAKNFNNPMDPEYKRLIRWIINYNEINHNDNAHLVISNKLLIEYYRTASHSPSPSNIAAIIDKLSREGRIIKITNIQIKGFKRIHFTKRIRRILTCNINDRDHIPVVLLSYRKMALSLDNNFLSDLLKFKGYKVIAGRRPQDIPYNG